MKRIPSFSILLLTLVSLVSCAHKTPEAVKKPLLEVEGKFLYLDELQHVIPPNIADSDSTEIAQSFIRKWVTDVLMYENAKRNVTNKTEIDELVESYRKSLTIHQYQQKMIEQRLPKEVSEEQLQSFYTEYGKQLVLKENIIQGLLLIVPAKAPKLANVRSWVQSANAKSLESIEKYSIQNAISYDYFGNKWMPFTGILKKIPLQVQDPAAYLNSNRFVETSDSLQHYFLRITNFRTSGSVEPFEMAKDRITNIILNKNKADFILKFETELYDDAVKNEDVSFYK
ncbi:MAG: peptidylprolyl isomerase [Paludibacter sp.]|jgi:hypothetical protein